jgi:hypothetical protein
MPIGASNLNRIGSLDTTSLATSFSGSGTYYESTNFSTAVIGDGPALSVAFTWFHPTGGNSRNQHFMTGRFGTANGENGWEICLQGGRMRYSSYDNSGASTDMVYGDGQFTVENAWNQMVVYIDHSSFANCVWIVNGVDRTSSLLNGAAVGAVNLTNNNINWSNASATTSIRIGSQNPTAGYNSGFSDFQGSISQISVYAVATPPLIEKYWDTTLNLPRNLGVNGRNNGFVSPPIYHYGGANTFDTNSITFWGNYKMTAYGNPTTVEGPTFGNTPAYSIQARYSSVNEGTALIVYAVTVGLPPETLYWTIQSNAGDFATSSGSVTTITTGVALFTVTPTADVTTEGAETFTIALRTGSTSGPIVATTSTITINDTSLAPVEEWYYATSVSYGTPTEMSIDHTGDYIAVASSVNASGSHTLLLNKSGVKQWYKSNTLSTGNFTMNSVKVTSGGTVYIGGGISVNASDNYIEKIALDGTLQWHRRWGSSNAEGTTQIQNIHIDASENIHICGVDRSTSSQPGWAVGKISTGTTTPALTWGRRYYGSSSASSTNGPGDGSHCVVDSSGNVYAAGYFGFTNGYQAVGKWTSTGTFQAVRAINAFSSSLRVQGLGVDSSDNLYWILSNGAATSWPVQTAAPSSTTAAIYKITNLANLSGSYIQPPYRAYNQRNAKVKNNKMYFPSMSMGPSANQPGWMVHNCSDGSYSRDYVITRTSGNGTFKLSDISSSDDGNYVVFCGRVSGDNDGNGTEADVVVRVSATTGTKTFTVKGGTYSIAFNNWGGTGTGGNMGTETNQRMTPATSSLSFNTSGFTLSLTNTSTPTSVTTTL